MQIVRKILQQFDLFQASPILRAKQEPDVVNSCGGILSLLLLIAHGYLFFAQLNEVTNWKQIQSIQSQSNNIQNDKKMSQFVIGISVEGFPPPYYYPYMRFQFVQVTMRGPTYISQRTLKQQPCKLQHFSSIGQGAQASFYKYRVNEKICLSPNQKFNIQKPSTEQYTMLSIRVNNCRRLNQDNSPMYTGCQSQQNVTTGTYYWIRTHKYFTAVAAFINTAFNPTEKKATTKFIDLIWLTFTPSRGSESFVYFSSYTINTDTAILPYNQITAETGFKKDYSTESNFEAVIYFENINIYILMSTKQTTITRTVGKIDVVLSYVGGLFGIVVAFLSFFFISFNQYRYELLVAEGAFNYSDQGNQVKEHDFNFLQYVRYSVFDWIKTLTCHQMNWKTCRQIDETRQQANHQLDVTLLFRKIQHFEKVIEFLISDKENIGLYLTEPPAIEQVKRHRRIAQYYDKVIKGKAANTVQDIQVSELVFNYAMNQVLNNDQQTKSQLVINGSTTKRKLNEAPDKSRENILDRVFEQFKMDIDIDDVDLDQEQQKLEQQIAQAFFRMPQASRKRIQQKIPLKILHRLKRKHDSAISKESMAINLYV